MTELRTAIEDYISSLPSTPRFETLRREIEAILESLSEKGRIALGYDKDLASKALEIRTRLLFEKIGFDVSNGRPDLEDFIIQPPPSAQINDSLVLEVKSSKNPHVSRDNLRQLDDWVFDLSGEERARKEGLGGGVDPVAMLTQGLASRKKRHPTPHKGVMIFNGPLGVDFSARQRTCFDENDREFIEKRNFCIVSLSILIDYSEAFEKDEAVRLILWENIHKTAGMLNAP